MIRLAIALLIFIVTITFPLAARSDDWTPEDTALQAAYLALHVVDWGQTRDLVKTAKNETNIILGRSPHVDAVNGYFLATALIHTGISYHLPQPYRRYWQCVTIGIEAAATSINYRAGVKINF